MLVNISLVQLRGIANGLCCLHERGIVHGSVKAVCSIFCNFKKDTNVTHAQDNILISEDGEPLLANSGVSRLISQLSTMDVADTSMRRTAPEFVYGTDGVETFTKEADVWSFGMLIYVSNNLFSSLTRQISN